MISAYGLDGFAQAAEALVGEAYKRRDPNILMAVCRACTNYCAITAIAVSALLFLLKPLIINGMTDLPAVNGLLNGVLFLARLASAALRAQLPARWHLHWGAKNQGRCNGA